MANGQSALRIKGNLAAPQRSGQRAKVDPTDRVPAKRKKICAYCGHERTTLDFIDVSNGFVVARYRYWQQCRKKHLDLEGDHPYQPSIRAISGGLPSLGKGRR
jgi:hypothetical protein